MDLQLDPDKAPRELQLSLLITLAAMTRQAYQSDALDGLEPNVMQVLIAVDLHADGTVTELGQMLALKQPTVSTAITTLQKKGLMTAAPDPEDRRRQRRTVTAAGRKVIGDFVTSIDPELWRQLQAV